MTDPKCGFIALLLFLTLAIGGLKAGVKGQWFESFSSQARQSSTSGYYGNHQGGYEGSAAEWTREAFD